MAAPDPEEMKSLMVLTSSKVRVYRSANSGVASARTCIAMKVVFSPYREEGTK